MKRLLLNGCSFGECWSPTKEFISYVGCDEAVNISKVATSFQRTCRSTIEWIAKNGEPSFIIIPITYCHRWELAIGDSEDDIDGTWFPMQKKELITTMSDNISQLVDKEKLSQLIDLYYRCIPDIKTFWDKMFTEIVMLSAFLDSKNIRYLMFDMCNDFDTKHIRGYKGFDKLNLIRSNENIIDLFGFCGNKYMWTQMPNNKGQDFNIHHAPEQYKSLEKALMTHIKQ